MFQGVVINLTSPLCEHHASGTVLSWGFLADAKIGMYVRCPKCNTELRMPNDTLHAKVVALPPADSVSVVPVTNEAGKLSVVPAVTGGEVSVVPITPLKISPLRG